VPNLDDGVQFYTTGLGFELQRTLFEKSVAELMLGDATIYLIEQKEGSRPYPGADLTRSFERHWTPIHLDVIVEDMSGAVAKAIKAGAVHAGETSSNSWGRLTAFSDPFGHGLCLVEFSDNGYDSVAD
jgi:uncharacterized glyoxalase superfamily protein PhnB